ncbi:hypothetical protein SAMN05518672_107161 [Chitinophaga sp. CF118]|uniref:hypothetical protein n=1 Tax=Chitinophaga sp. CF118 TaxID=1884367 RepID=UPI0008F45690|nr:hypothetical protein [Chitinophaga sp. CF118]SFE54503.1 hypothetical protein SAMN05518672_107161 [Chitinophaga sp. CF118]
MKPHSLIASCALTCIASLLLQACNKYHDHSPGIPCCQIIQVRQGIFDEDSLAIVYNIKGNPVSITRANVGTGRPNFLFRYDKKGRMTDFYGVYTSPNPYFEIWHRYVYDGKNRIIVDSTYGFGLIGPGGPLPDHDGILRVNNISTYKYDWKDRMIESTDTYGKASTITTRTYTYNQEGNLAKLFTKSGMDTITRYFRFDDKVNFRLLHPIWQFLNRDYSMNNSLSVEPSNYNKYGLPQNAYLGDPFYGSFATIPLNFVVIRYSCK